MTIGVSALFNGTNHLGQQNGDEQGHYKSVLKQQKGTGWGAGTFDKISLNPENRRQFPNLQPMIGPSLG